MRAGNVACDCKPQAGAAFILVARLVQAIERPEHVLAESRVYSGSIVVDNDRQELSLEGRRNTDVVGETLGVGDDIVDAEDHHLWPNTEIEISSRLHTKARAMPLGSLPEVFKYRCDVDLGGCFPRVATREGKIALVHLPHLIDILLQKFALG